MVDWGARRFGSKVAFVDGEREVSFAEVGTRARALAAGLLELGLRPGDRVGIFLENRFEGLEAEFAVALAGGVRVPMLSTLTAAEMAHYIDHAEARFVIAGEHTEATLTAARKDATVPVQVVFLGRSADDSAVDYDALAAAASTASLPDPGEDDLHAIRFTGGTTGKPKAVTMSNRSMVNVIENMLLNWPIGSDETVLSIHPLSHASGMISYPFWAAGATNVIRPAFRFDPHDFLAAVERHRVTAVFLIPTILNLLLDSDACEKFDHSSLRMLIYGGAPIPLRRLREGLDTLGPVFVQVYGTSEAPMLLTTLLREEHEFDPDGEVPEHLHSAGREALGVEVRVGVPAGTPAATGEVGEIEARGPNNMVGYWRNEELTEERLRDGWVRTGDMGRFDADGYLYIVDRKEDMVITGGFNVWPAEIEDVIYSHGAVKEAAVFGVEHDKWGEAVVAAVLPRGEGPLAEAELIDFLRDRLAPYKVPKRILIRDEEIPRSGVGKMLRRQVREEHADELADFAQ
jgi:acyl-CoA synthetase (AMP-forming)/AMP-acid ligase II